MRRLACRRRRRRAAVALAVAAVAGVPAAVAAPSAAVAPRPSAVVGPWDWPTYGHDAQHTFSAPTTLTRATVTTLQPAWSFATGDAVTATPTVVAGTVYVGSWDGWFYALDLVTGALRWKFQLDAQPAVIPQPGVVPRPFYSDGGLVTSSAWFEAGDGTRPDLVIFGGGFTLYALNAQTGALFWKHPYSGRPDLPPDPVNDGTRIFSSPAVADGRVLFGVSVDGARGYRGYIAAADLATGNPVWTYETDVDAGGQIQNDGCGNVWSSGTILPAQQVVVFDTADCHSANTSPYSESFLALSISTGQLVWQFKPARADAGCDIDFGASPNAGIDANGVAHFLGAGGKDGTYYSVDPRTGAERWSTNVVFGGSAGGFIGTAAYDGSRIYGTTGLGDFPGPPCDPGDPRDTGSQEPSLHALDHRGGVHWEMPRFQSFAPTTVAGGMVFSPVALNPVVKIRGAADGARLAKLHLPVPSWAGIAVVGDAVVVGTGTSYAGSPDGVIVFTPGGTPPVEPGS